MSKRAAEQRWMRPRRAVAVRDLRRDRLVKKNCITSARDRVPRNAPGARPRARSRVPIPPTAARGSTALGRKGF